MSDSTPETTPEISRRGLILINTRPGKGKTTAALGPALARAVTPDPNPPAAPSAQNFVIKQLGRGFVKVGGAETDPEDIRLVEAAWEESAAAILSGEWDLGVLDEINYAIGYKMLAPEVVAEVLRRKPEM